MPPATNLAGIFGIYGVAVPYGASFVSAYIRTLIDECSHYYPDDGRPAYLVSSQQRYSQERFVLLNIIQSFKGGSRRVHISGLRSSSHHNGKSSYKFWAIFRDVTRISIFLLPPFFSPYFPLSSFFLPDPPLQIQLEGLRSVVSYEKRVFGVF